MARIIFISGGVRSGKSQLAEELAIKRAQWYGKQLHYVATGERSDKEMLERITHHQQSRQKSGQHWKTWEQPREIHQLASNFSANDIILLDCITTLLNNEFFYDNRWSNQAYQLQLGEKLLKDIKELASAANTLILVSNEILHDVMSEEPLVRVYGKLLGTLHQRIVEVADEAYLVESGCLIRMKGGDGHERHNDRWDSF